MRFSLKHRRKKKPASPQKRFIVGVSVGLLITLSVAFFAVPVRQAQAFPGEAMGAAIWKFASEVARDGWKIAKEAAEQAYKITKDVAFKNALRIYLTKIAEDTATYIATGDPGQKPLFLTKPGEYFLDVGDAALGDYLDTISSGALGASICDIGPVKIKIDLALRAEINPNFCKDGCQRLYEKDLNGDADYIAAEMSLSGELSRWQSEQFSYWNTTCPDITDAVQCANSEGCLWDSTREPSCYAKDETTFDILLRALIAPGGAYDEVFGVDNPANPFNYCAVDELASSCLTKYRNYIESEQFSAESTRNTCLRICEGTKRTAKCTFSQIKERSVAAYNASEFNVTYPQIFTPEQNEVGQYLLTYETAREQAEVERQAARDSLTFDEIGPLKSIISGSIVSPSTLTKKAAEKPVEEAGKDTTTYTGSPLADAIGVFTDTLTKKLIERIFNPQKGFSNPSAPTSFATGSGGYNSGGIAAAKAQFAKDFTPNITRQGNVNIDPISSLVEDGVMDQDFAEAVRQGLTLEKAIEQNLIHADWWFGYNQNRKVPEVGNAGYPATSFPILRSNRVIPVGWEIAAEYIDVYDQGSFSLAQVLAGFDDEDSPFYRLVDPKWVLKAPFALCAKEGYGGKVAEDSCIASQPVSSYLSGNSGATGDGCTAGEHDTDGDGDCDTDDPPIFENICQREQVCVDQQTCIQETPDGQGCEEYGYCTKELPIWRFQGEQCDAQFASCQGYIADTGEQVSYLSSTLDDAACGPDNVGCQRYCYLDTATGEFNCTYDESNQSFTGNRIHFDNDVIECSATDAGCTQLIRTTNGSNILPNSGFEYFATPYPVADQADFDGWVVGGSGQTCGAQSFADQVSSSGAAAMRLQSLAACGGPGGAQQYAQTTIDTGRPITDRAFSISFDARALNAPCAGDIIIDAPGFTSSITPTYTSNFQRFNTSVVFTGIASNTFTLQFNAIQNCPIVIDSIKIEEGGSSTAFSSYGTSSIMMKLPPADLSCTGDPATDSAECAQYAAVCSAGDVGCMAFTPVDGGITIPGKVTDPGVCDFENNPGACDQCPAAFAGCQALREVELTAKVPQANHPTRDPLVHYPSPPAVAAGYVSIVPETGVQCTASYVGCEEYTNLDEVARGGEGLGYFTTVRQCVDTNDPDKAFYFSWEGSASTGFELVRYELKQSNIGTGPCTNLGVSSNPNAACVDGTPGNPVNDCSADWRRDPNCYEFLDETGNAFYRYLDEVIFVTDQCQPHRNTLDGQTYYFDATQSQVCPASFNGCREYRGAAANNTRTIISDDFESAQNPLNGWGGTLSSESTYYGGHSMVIGAGWTTKSTTPQQGKTYILSFWAKADVAGAPLRAAFDTAPNNRFFTWNDPSTQISIGTDWQYYRLGPIEIDWGVTPTSLAFSDGGNVYIDNIVLLESTENIFLIRDSASQCNGFEGCRAFTDQQGQSQYLKSFTRLCEGSAVGCEALINTHNSTYPFAQSISADSSYPQGNGSFGSQIPRDTVQFFVNDRTKYCADTAKGCMELGSMSTGQDLEVINTTSVYLKNDPDQFATILCQEEAVGCKQYQELENQSSLAFFKDPGERVCEYRENDNGLTGWFAKGTNDGCNPTWTKTCPIEQSTCREYYAPRLYENPASPGENSYYYLDKSLDKNVCSAGIDPRNSCLGFQDVEAGNNIARPRFADDDTNTVVAQSCTVCSPDPQTCGRNGNSPCCSWSSSTCSTDRAEGLDDIAPHYCVLESSTGEAGFQSCMIPIAGSYAVPNSSVLAQATNCGATGLPTCYDMDGTQTPSTTDDWNAANEALRNCADFACTTNVIIPVTADRMCAEWLECTKETTVMKSGKETTVCLERALKNSEDRFVKEGEGDNVQENLVKTSPSNIKDLANYSGLVNAGMFRSVDGQLLDGLFPYSQFEEDGLYGAFVDVPNGNFEDYKISVAESPVPVRSSFSGGSWISADDFDWRPTQDASGTDTSQLDLAKTEEPDIFSNQYLRVTSRNTGANGARVIVDTIGNITENAQYYMVSFKGRRNVGSLQGMTIDIVQEGVGPVFLDLTTDGVQLTDQWQEYVVKLYNNPGLQVDPREGNILLEFLHKKGNVPSESFEIDDVSLKPVLHIQDGRALTPEQGLYGLYFQAKMVPAPGSQQGLRAEFWDTNVGAPGLDLPDENNPSGVPYTKFINDFVNFDHPSFSPPPTIQKGICSGGGRNGQFCINDSSCPTNTPVAPDYDYQGPFFACTGLTNENTSYAVRYTGGIFIEESDENRFYFNKNDGAKFYVEDLNTDLFGGTTWGPAACIGVDTTIYDMPEGWHPVKIEWYNQPNDGGGLQFGWHPGSGGLPYNNEFAGCGATCGAHVEICNNGSGGDLVPAQRLITELTIDPNAVFTDGFLVGSDIDATIDFPNFNTRLNENANRGDAVGVRWVGEILADADGQYNFRVRHKDGFRLYIDDLATPLGEDWTEGADRTTTVGPYTMSAGWHQIQVEFFKGLDENADTAVMQFGWDRAGSTPMGGGFNVVPEDHLRSFPPTETGFVGKECRSYPQTDSIVCDYTDPQSGVNYIGWKGYCVERDPRDSSVCLNWWPIDVLSGETNIFSDQADSLTRSPLYMCAETRVKTFPTSIPRYVCLSNYKADDENGMAYDRCHIVAIVNDPLPAAYELQPSDGWIYGSDSITQGDGDHSCNLTPWQSSGVCCVLNQDQFNNAACTSEQIAQSTVNSGDSFITNQAEWDRCTGELDKYFGQYTIQIFTDDGGRDSEGCSADDWGDNNTDCKPGGDDCYYRSLIPTSPFICGLATFCTLEGHDAYGAGSYLDLADYPEAYTFPMQCTTVVKVTETNGESSPWTAKVQSGTYAFPPGQPTLFSQITACSPWGSAPVIKNTGDIVSCIPDPNDPPPNGCTTVNGPCEKLISSESGNCILGPMELYHPNNPDNNNISQICSDTRLGGGFFSCGTSGICKTCVGGDRNGLSCQCDSSTAGSSLCPDDDGDGFSDVNDCPGEGNPLSSIDPTKTAPTCEQTFGRDPANPQPEVLGNPDDTFLYQPLTTQAPYSEDPRSGIARIKQLFVRSFGFWTWDDGAQKYIWRNDVNNWGPPKYNNPNQQCPATTTHETEPNAYCGIEPIVSNITISGGYVSGSDVILHAGGDNRVDLTFDYRIDKEQEPLSSISIDWGDGDTRPLYQSTNASRTYGCDSDSVNCTSCLSGGSLVAYPDPTDLDGFGNPITKTACVYPNYPRVQVRDNWNWCNIRDAIAYTGEDSCNATSDFWDWYDGRLVVLP